MAVPTAWTEQHEENALSAPLSDPTGKSLLPALLLFIHLFYAAICDSGYNTIITVLSREWLLDGTIESRYGCMGFIFLQF
jgi:hypothetical protein